MKNLQILSQNVTKVFTASFETVTSTLSQMTGWANEAFFVAPLRRLYFSGPDLKSFGILSLGFWNGLANSEICAQLTSIPERHWDENPETCTDRIDRQFMAFVVTVEFTLYVCTIVYLTKRLFEYYFPDSLTREMRALRKCITEYGGHQKSKRHEKNIAEYM